MKLAYFAYISHVLLTLGTMVHALQITMHIEGIGR